MSKTIEIKDIAQWEENDSELAKYTIQSLSSLIKNQEEQLKANDLMINELINRINKAIEYINSFVEVNPDYDSSFYSDSYCKTWIGFEDIVENTTKILRGTNE